MKNTFVPHYSGELSKLFWKKIHRIPRKMRDERPFNEAYTLGVVLQDIEGVVLRQIERIARETKSRE